MPVRRALLRPWTWLEDTITRRADAIQSDVGLLARRQSQTQRDFLCIAQRHRRRARDERFEIRRILPRVLALRRKSRGAGRIVAADGKSRECEDAIGSRDRFAEEPRDGIPAIAI